MIRNKGQERRTSIRAKRVMSIDFKLIKSGRRNVNKRSYLSLTEEMSIGGLSFYTEQELRIDDILELRVIMSGVLDVFTGTAKVVRVERKEKAAYDLVAVQFIGQDEKSRSAKTYSTTRKQAIKKINDRKRRV